LLERSTWGINDDALRRVVSGEKAELRSGLDVGEVGLLIVVPRTEKIKHRAIRQNVPNDFFQLELMGAFGV
jgi:hypothetical protein